MVGQNLKEKVGGKQLCKETKYFPFPHYKTNSPPFAIPLFSSKNFPSPLQPFLKIFMPSLYERGWDGGSSEWRGYLILDLLRIKRFFSFNNRIVVSAPQITTGKSSIPIDVFQGLDIYHLFMCNFVVINKF